MGQVHLHGKMEKYTQDSGKITRCMERGDTHGHQVNHMMKTGWQAIEKDMAYAYIQMVANMKDSGRMTTDMEEGSTLIRVGIKKLGSGSMAKKKENIYTLKSKQARGLRGNTKMEL